MYVQESFNSISIKLMICLSEMNDNDYSDSISKEYRTEHESDR
jgi:hypothetical protein